MCRVGHRCKNFGKAGRTADQFKVICRDQPFAQEQHVDLFAAAVHVHNVLKKLGMGFVVEVFCFEYVDDVVTRIGHQQHAAEDTLFGGEVKRHLTIDQRIVVVFLIPSSFPFVALLPRRGVVGEKALIVH